MALKGWAAIYPEPEQDYPEFNLADYGIEQDEMPEPEDYARMRPYIFGEES